MSEESAAVANIGANHDRFNRMLFETLPIGLAICDMTGKMAYINEAFASIIGHTVNDALELTYWQVTPIEYEQHEQQQLESLKTTGRYGPYEKDYIHKDGHLVPVRLNGVLIHENGEDYIWSSVEDISGRKDAEKALVDAMYAAESANRIKNEFLASMSHELRTPLNAILGFSGAMTEETFGPLNNVHYKEYVDSIHQSGEHLLGLVDDILDLSRLESNSIELHVERIRLSDVVGSVCHFTQQLVAEYGVSFVDECSGVESVEILVDPARLKQVLLNLFSNAAKYNKKGGAIRFGCEVRDNDMLRVLIHDTGRGIAPEDRSRVFEPFDRLGISSSDVMGTGIGLSISYRFVESMGGRIGFDSVVGKGSTFWVDLPIAAES